MTSDAALLAGTMRVLLGLGGLIARGTFPDPQELTDQQLIELIDSLSHDDQETEYLRGVAQRKVEILRAALAERSGGGQDDPS